MENRIHNISMFILCISVAIAIMFIGCNDKPEPVIKPQIDYNEYITQSVQYDYYDEVYELTTTADYRYHTVYIEIDNFSDEDILTKLKEQRFNEAKVIIDNLIKFNK